jgi:peptidoglycan/LPS O-acetylase OafA/YrhL
MINGGDAVKIFFMISGFYMAMILLEKYGQTRMGLINFAISRILRLYPLYLVILALTISWHFTCEFSTHGGTPTPTILRLSALMPWWQTSLVWFSNIFLIGVDIPSLFHWSKPKGFEFLRSLPFEERNGTMWLGFAVWVRQAWSIGAEVCFYCLSPLIVFSSWNGWKGVLIAGIGSILIAKVCTVYFMAPIYFFWPALLVYFVTGIVLYKLYRLVELDRLIPKSITWRLVIFCSSLVWTVVLPSVGSSLPALALYGVAAISIPLLFAATKANRLDRIIGNLSYATYLNHLLVASIVSVVVKRLEITPHFSTGLVIIGSVLFALVLERLIERPIELIRIRFSSR